MAVNYYFFAMIKPCRSQKRVPAAAPGAEIKNIYMQTNLSDS